MRPVDFGILNEKSARAFAQPLNDAFVRSAFQKSLDPVEWIGGAAAGSSAAFLRRFRPLVNEGERYTEVGSHLLRTAFLDDFAKQLVGFHPANANTKKFRAGR